MELPGSAVVIVKYAFETFYQYIGATARGRAETSEDIDLKSNLPNKRCPRETCRRLCSSFPNADAIIDWWRIRGFRLWTLQRPHKRVDA